MSFSLFSYDVGPVFSLWIFIVFMVGTPGPANLLMMTVGSRYGTGAAMPFNAGLVLGKMGLNLSMAIGVGFLLTTMPVMLTALKFLSAAVMIFLSVRTLGGAADAPELTAPPGWRSGLIVHPLNPKAWVMTVLAWTEFGPQLGSAGEQTLIICTSFAVAQLLLHSLWALAGQLLSQALGQSVWLNRGLVALTCSVVLWAVLI